MQKKYKLLTYFEFLSYLAIIGAVLISYITYHNVKSEFSDKFAQEKRIESARLNNQISEILAHVEKFTNIIALRISEADSNDPKIIARILKDVSLEVSDEKNFFTWTVFDFAAPNGKIIATSQSGVVEKEIMIPKEKRSWMIDAPKSPWKLHISKSDSGIVSGEKIIPCGYAVTDKNKKLLGIITLGISVKKLQQKLEETVASPISSFAILNSDNSIILTSKSFDEDDLSQEIKFENDLDGFFDLNKRSYYHASIDDNLGLKVMVGVNKQDAYIEILSELLPKIITIAYLTLLFLILLYLIRAKLLRPVLELSEIVSKISNGQLDCNLPDSKIHEISVLAKSIDMVQDFLIREKEAKSRLQEKTTKIEQAFNNKTDLIHAFSTELREMIVGITGLAQIMKANFRSGILSRDKIFGNLDAMNNESYVNDIIKISNEASHFVSDVSNLNEASRGAVTIIEKELVDVHNLVLDVIKVLRSKAMQHGRQIYTNIDFAGSSSEFLATNIDEVRTKQVVFNVLNNAIDHAFKSGIIEILVSKLSAQEVIEVNELVKRNIVANDTIDTQKKSYLLSLIRNKKSRISISIRDNGIGISEYKMRMIKKDAASVKNKIAGKVNMIDLDISVMKYIVEFQGGLFEIDSKSGYGTVVTMIF